MKVQKIILPDSEKESWIVLGKDLLPIRPIFEYLKYLQATDRSPFTVRNAATHLAEYWRFLEFKQLEWKSAKVSDIADFVSWLRLPQPEVLPIFEVEAKRTNATINNYLGTLSVFYEFQEAQKGQKTGLTLFTSRVSPNKRYKPFLHHISKGRPTRTRLVKVKVQKKEPRIIESANVHQLMKACERHRDRFLIGVLYHGGLRIGQALGLRHEDVESMNNVIHIVPRNDNINRVRAKTRDQYSIPVTKELMKLYSDYLIEEFGEIQSDYVFVNLWGGSVGRPMGYMSVHKLFERLWKKTGIRVTPHMFRHTRATELIKAGARIEIVQKVLGHKNLSTTTSTYDHSDLQDLKKELQDADESIRKLKRKQ